MTKVDSKLRFGISRGVGTALEVAEGAPPGGANGGFGTCRSCLFFSAMSSGKRGDIDVGCWKSLLRSGSVLRAAAPSDADLQLDVSTASRRKETACSSEADRTCAPTTLPRAHLPSSVGWHWLSSGDAGEASGGQKLKLGRPSASMTHLGGLGEDAKSVSTCSVKTGTASTPVPPCRPRPMPGRPAGSSDRARCLEAVATSGVRQALPNLSERSRGEAEAALL